MRKVLVTFTKAQLSALVGGMTDYSIMVFVTEAFHVKYTYSIAIGGIIGAVANFNLNKIWTFNAGDMPYKSSTNVQMFRFSVVVLNSILLKTGGTYLITNLAGLDYKISRIFADLLVSVVFNYHLQKFWVFRKAC